MSELGQRPPSVAKRTLATILLLAVSACATSAAPGRDGADAGAPTATPSDGPGLYPICVGARFGFIDRSGKVVVHPTLGMIDETIGELTVVWVLDPVPPEKEQPGLPPSAHAGLIDTRGRFAVKPIYEDARTFSEGLAAVMRDGKWGFVDSKGTVRVPCRNESAQSFSEGLALVEDETGQKFIDTSGRTVIDVARLRWRRKGQELPVIADGPFVDGLAAFRVIFHGEYPDTLVGFMDRQGTIVIEPAFTYSYAFQRGYAKVQVLCGGGTGGRCEGIIRKDGSWAIPPAYEFLAGVYDGLVAFTAPVGKRHLHGFLDEQNEVVVPPRYEHSCLWFREGLCQTKIGKHWAYVDRSGAEQIVLPPDTEYADEFSDGIAQVRTKAGDHYIRRDGSRAFEGTFKDASRFRRGLAYVQFLEGGEGYIDPQGRIVYRQAEPCKPW